MHCPTNIAVKFLEGFPPFLQSSLHLKPLKIPQIMPSFLLGMKLWSGTQNILAAKCKGYLFLWEKESCLMDLEHYKWTWSMSWSCTSLCLCVYCRNDWSLQWAASLWPSIKQLPQTKEILTLLLVTMGERSGILEIEGKNKWHNSAYTNGKKY